MKKEKGEDGDALKSPVSVPSRWWFGDARQLLMAAQETYQEKAGFCGYEQYRDNGRSLRKNFQTQENRHPIEKPLLGGERELKKKMRSFK